MILIISRSNNSDILVINRNSLLVSISIYLVVLYLVYSKIINELIYSTIKQAYTIILTYSNLNNSIRHLVAKASLA